MTMVNYNLSEISQSQTSRDVTARSDSQPLDTDPYTLVPLELKQLDQWVVWRRENRKGKGTKVPYDGNSGRNASTTNRNTWCSFDEATQAAANGTYDGIGFVFTSDDPFCGIDFDHVIQDGRVDPKAEQEILNLNSYTEFGPSGDGFHVIVKTDQNLYRNSKALEGGAKFEIYNQGRYFTITGDVPTEFGSTTVNRDETALSRCVNAFLGEEAISFGGEREPDYGHAKSPLPSIERIDDDEVIRTAKAAKNGEKFRSLFEDGDLSNFGGDRSSADLALCGMLAYWTDNHIDQMDRLFRLSALMRPKWDEGRGLLTYGERTLAKATSETRMTLPLNRSQEEPFHTTDLGNAKRFANLHGNDVRYIHSWGCWLIWDGCRWNKDDVEKVVDLGKQTALSIYDEADASSRDERNELEKWAKRSEGKARIDAQIDLAKSEPRIAMTHSHLDSDDFLFNVANGTLDLRTGKLLDFDRGHLITKISQVRYEPKATCPLWDRFLHRIMGGDSDLVAFVQRFVGYSLTGDTSEQCLVFLYGNGANGKSTLIEVLRLIFGDYFQKAPTSLILQRRDGNQGIPNDVARLPGCRMVSAAEVEEGSFMAESKLKDLTGGDQITARFLHQEFFDFSPTHKLWLYGNHRPVIRGSDDGIWRRIHQIPFEVTIPENERDPHLKEKLELELPGILNWCLRGCLDWQEHGLRPPKSVAAATKNYRDDMDIIGEFLEECTISDPTKGESKTNVYNVYRTWAEQNGHRQMSKNLLGRKLMDRRIRDGKEDGKRAWLGIRLNQDWIRENTRSC